MTTISSTSTATSLAYFVGGAISSALLFYVLFPKHNGVAIVSPVVVKNSSNTDDDDDDDDDDDEDDEQVLSVDDTNNDRSQRWGMMDSPYKIILVVNKSLKMKSGKIAAQCGHASVGCYKRAQRQCPNALKAWERTGCAKVALSCPTQDEMEAIMEQAYEKNIPFYLVEDAGRTQIAAGSRTVLGLGPAPAREFEGVSDHLKLL